MMIVNRLVQAPLKFLLIFVKRCATWVALGVVVYSNQIKHTAQYSTSLRSGIETRLLQTTSRTHARNLPTFVF